MILSDMKLTPSSALLACLLCALPGKPAEAAVIVTLPTATTTGSIVFTHDLTFTILGDSGRGILGFIVFDEWVTSDGSRSAIALPTPYHDLHYSMNGGPDEARWIRYGGLVDNFAGTEASVTPNDGYFGARDIMPLEAGDVLTLKAATYILPMVDVPDFNPQANQVFTGNVFIIGPFGYALTDMVSAGPVPEPSCALLLAAHIVVVAARRMSR